MTDKIKEALRKLDPNDDGDWTEGGLPSMARMKELTGMDDLTRQKIGEADPGFKRDTLQGKKENRGDNGQTPPKRTAKQEEQTPEDLIQPNLDPESNPNVGRTDLGPYEGQAHTADQRENLHAEEAMEEAGDVSVSEGDDPIALMERVVAAGSTDRYRRNGELQNLIRHYQVNQVAIKDMQGRLDERNERREERRG